MPPDLVEEVRRLAWVAADLDARGYPFAGTVRRTARLLLTVVTGDTVAAGDVAGCAGCGAALVQPATGRRRRWCSERCRSRARRR